VTLPFTLEAVSEFLVDTYDGFDRPNTAQLVDLLGDGSGSGNDQVLQQGNSPYLQATITGTLTSLADVTLVRGYYDSRDELTFTDGDGEAHGVRILEFAARAFTGWWTFTMQLVETTPPVPEGS
jgi:hypothetical protein